jgi:hypothetical protein
MRINLRTPFAEKDQVKALGARWDAARKVWYIVDPADLAPFMRWIPDLAAAQMTAAPASVQASHARARPERQVEAVAERPAPAAGVASCGCDVLPWEACVHTPGAGTA